MAQLLREVVREAPLLDEAGPERVLSLLLARAPGWPIGPGDVEESLVQARRAVELRPDYPPNQVALGEALLKNDARVKAQEALVRAIDLATRAPFASDPDAPSWMASARALQQR
jgi:Flp pilus assembly protein TadD